MPLILPWKGVSPRVHKETFIAPTATVIGDVEIGEKSSIWFGAIVRGDVNSIRIGKRTNIQDMTMCHVTSRKFDLVVGDDVVCGHSVILHGCHVGNGCVIGMGATILDGVEIGDNCVVAAGAVCREGTKFPAGSLIAGVPATVKREVPDEIRKRFATTPAHYWSVASEYLEQFPEFKLKSDDD